MYCCIRRMYSFFLGYSVPVGAYVRMNMTTGKREAKFERKTPRGKLDYLVRNHKNNRRAGPISKLDLDIIILTNVY